MFYSILILCCLEQNAGLKSIGKAVSKGTKKIGKTLTTLADSPDKRAKQRVAKMATPKAKGGRKRRGNNFKQRSSSSLGLDIGKFKKVVSLVGIHTSLSGRI